MERTIPLGRGGKYGQMVVDDAKFTAAVNEHVYMYGLRQILNDAIADKTDDDGATLPSDQLVAKAQKRLDALYSGELRVRNAAEPADPVEAEMYRIAKAALTVMARETDEYKSAPKGTKDRAMFAIAKRAEKRGEVATWETSIARWIAAHPDVRKTAQRIVKDREIGDFDL